MRLLVVSCAPLVSTFTLSLACLLLTAITIYDTCDCDGLFPRLQIAPFYPSCLSSVLHTVTQADTAPHFAVCLRPPHLLLMF